MGPKRSSKKVSTRRGQGDGMRLRSGPVKKRSIHQEASSRNVQHNTPKKRGKISAKCIYVDDEAIETSDFESVERLEEASNIVTDDPSERLIVTPTSLIVHESVVVADGEDPKHHRHFGESVGIGLMNDVLSQFFIKRKVNPPSVPLCRLIPTDAVRFATSDNSWLLTSFDRCGYMHTMSMFIVSIKGRYGEIKLATNEVIERWDPIWQQRNAEFESQLGEEWKDLSGKLLHVYDGNHRLKTWMKRVDDGKLFIFAFLEIFEESYI